jgi:hypothetical protein
MLKIWRRTDSPADLTKLMRSDISSQLSSKPRAMALALALSIIPTWASANAVLPNVDPYGDSFASQSEKAMHTPFNTSTTSASAGMWHVWCPACNPYTGTPETARKIMARVGVPGELFDAMAGHEVPGVICFDGRIREGERFTNMLGGTGELSENLIAPDLEAKGLSTKVRRCSGVLNGRRTVELEFIDVCKNYADEDPALNVALRPDDSLPAYIPNNSDLGPWGTTLDGNDPTVQVWPWDYQLSLDTGTPNWSGLVTPLVPLDIFIIPEQIFPKRLKQYCDKYKDGDGHSKECKDWRKYIPPPCPIITETTPEPSGLALLGSALAGLAIVEVVGAFRKILRKSPRNQ